MVNNIKLVLVFVFCGFNITACWLDTSLFVPMVAPHGWTGSGEWHHQPESGNITGCVRVVSDQEKHNYIPWQAYINSEFTITSGTICSFKQQNHGTLHRPVFNETDNTICDRKHTSCSFYSGNPLICLCQYNQVMSLKKEVGSNAQFCYSL